MPRCSASCDGITGGQECGKLLVKEIVSRHGVPSEILSDRGKAFMSGLMTEVKELLGSHRVNTTAYGQTC